MEIAQSGLLSDSVQSLHRLGHWGDMRDNSAEILFWLILQEALVSSFGMGRDVHFFCSSSISSADHSVAHPPRSLKVSYGLAVMACNIPEPCKFLSLDSCQKRFLWSQWTHKEADLASHPSVLKLLRTCQRPSCQTLSNTFLKSMK